MDAQNQLWTVHVKINNGEVLHIDVLASKLKDFQKAIFVSGVKKIIIQGEQVEWISPYRICEVMVTKKPSI